MERRIKKFIRRRNKYIAFAILNALTSPLPGVSFGFALQASILNKEIEEEALRLEEEANKSK